LFYPLSFIAIPDIVLTIKAPGKFLMQQRQYINNQTVIVADHRLARAACWFYRRNNIYLLFNTNEFGYGINYSGKTKRRLLDAEKFRQLATVNKGNLVLILTRKHYRKYLLKRKLLPPPAKVTMNHTCAFLQY